jgi:hypothetical protein
MLALVSLFVGAFVVAVCAIWLYRVMFGVQNYQTRTVGKKRSSSAMKPSAKQGFFSLKRKSAKKAQAPKAQISKARPQLRAANGANKVPWGW